eukprot:11168147-Lingulodinium_polyedra.AAC.1
MPVHAAPCHVSPRHARVVPCHAMPYRVAFAEKSFVVGKTNRASRKNRVARRGCLPLAPLALLRWRARGH